MAAVGEMEGGMAAVTATWSEQAGRRCVQALPLDERLILPALQALQSTFGYVPEPALSLVAEELNLSRAEVVGVLTYYHDLRTPPPAPVTVRLCVAEACQAVGVRDVVADLPGRFGAALGEATPDGTVEFQQVFCLGNCALGPAAQVNGRLLARCDVGTIARAIDVARDGAS